MKGFYAVEVEGQYVAVNPTPRPATDRSTGWRPLVWRRDPREAEKFPTRSDAEVWTLAWLEHDLFTVEYVAVEVSRATD
jgi:hypothetical protein